MIQIDVSGPPMSGKTRTIMRIAAELTRTRGKVAVVNTIEPLSRLDEMFLEFGGDPEYLSIIPAEAVTAKPWRYVITETNLRGGL